MEFLFELTEKHPSGALLVLLYVLGLMLIVHWAAWTFALGRFKDQPRPIKPQNLGFLVTEALTKVINDFRHLLALILVLIFSFSLAYALYQAGNNMESIKDALQAVTSTLGGLIGSIIGYYFGESKVRRELGVGNTGADAIPEVQPPASPAPPQPAQAPSATPPLTPSPIRGSVRPPPVVTPANDPPAT